MTSHYLDITVVPDQETSVPQVLGVLYGRLHMALVEHGKGRIGVSFPRYSLHPRTLGNLLRLHGDAASLEELFRRDWLKGARDNVRLSGILPVPGHAKHRSVQRRQFKTSAERLRRRRMRRKGESEQQARTAIPTTVERRPDVPFVRMHSASTKQPFHLFIATGPLLDEPIEGLFTTYGLARASTVPWF